MTYKADPEHVSAPAAETGSVRDPERLSVLRDLDLLDVPAEETFDRLTRLAVDVLEVPAAFLALVDEDRDFFLSECGLPDPLASTRQITGRTFCHYAIESESPLVIEDARVHPIYRTVPTVESLGVVAYVGVPLRFEGGVTLGSFCVVDTEPRSWTERDVRVLEGLAGSAMAEIQLRRNTIEHERTAEALRESESRFRLMVEAGDQVFFYEHDSEGRFTYLSPGVVHILGYTAEELVGKHYSVLLGEAPANDVVTERTLAALEGNGSEGAYTAWTCHRDGRVVPVEVVESAVRRDGEIIGLQGFARDISRRKRAEAALAAAEAHYRRLVTTSPLGVYVLDSQGRFAETNLAGERLLARRAENLLGRYAIQVIAPEDRGLVSSTFDRVLAGELDTVDLRARIQRPSGELRMLHLTATPVREEGVVTGLHGTARDITEEQAKEQRMRLLSMALETLDQGVCIQDAHTLRVLYANAGHARLYGYDPARVHEIASAEFLPDAESEEQLRAIRRTMTETAQWSGRIRRRRADNGQVVTLGVISGQIEDTDGQPLIFSVYHDASQEIEAEQQLRRSERLASVGMLVGGVAHELNNPLQAIRSFAQLMLLEERNAEDQEALEVINHETGRMAKIVSDLKQVARQAHEERAGYEPVDLNAVVRHVLKVRRYALETSNVEVREELDEDLPMLFADRSQMEQILLNLVVNAEQAMTGQDRPKQLILRTYLSDWGVVLETVDTGPGIPAGDVEHIFDPFWTTKEPGSGTGLGLSLVHSMVREHGGDIYVESEPGSGTHFRIHLPGAAEDERPSATPRIEERPSESLRILVVDDEAPIRRALTLYLERQGHTVDTADEGGTALQYLETNQYDVILSDLRMPGLGGEQLLQRLRATDLDDRLVFLTGDAVGKGHSFDGDGIPVLMKPVQLEAVGRIVLERAFQSR